VSTVVIITSGLLVPVQLPDWQEPFANPVAGEKILILHCKACSLDLHVLSICSWVNGMVSQYCAGMEYGLKVVKGLVRLGLILMVQIADRDTAIFEHLIMLQT